MDRSSLEALITWDKTAIALASLIVALGLIGEYWKEIKNLWRIFWDMYPIEYLPLFKSIAAESRKTLLFPILVVAGVSAEWIYESDSSVHEAEYAKLLDTDNTRHTAAERAAIDRAALAESKAAESEKGTEDLQSKNIALEAEIAPRNIFDDEATEIIDSLKSFAGREISVKSYLGDTEGHRLLFVVAQILFHAGLHVTPGLWYFDDSPKVMLLEGMEIDAPPEQKDFAAALQKAFSRTKLGIRSQWFIADVGTPVTLKIGVKPFQMPKFP
jgi:hypothetical protein